MFEEVENLDQLQSAQFDLYQIAALGFRVPKKATHVVMILVILSIAIPILVSVVGAYYSYSSYLSRARESMNHTVEAVRENTRQSVTSMYSVAKEADGILSGLTDEQIRTDEASIRTQLKGLATGVEEIEDIWVLNRNGIPLLSASLSSLPESLDLSDRDYFRAHSDGLVKPGAAFVSQVLKGRIRGRISFEFSWSRKNERGDFGGVIGVTVEPRYFSDFFSTFVNKSASAIMLIRDDGVVLAQSSVRLEDLLELQISPNILEGIRKRSGDGVFEASLNIDGITRPQLIAYAKAPGSPIYVVASLDKNAITSAWKNNLLKMLSLGGPLMLGLWGFGALAYRVTRIREELEERFRQFTEHSSAAIWTMNAADMRFDYLSPAFETISGMGRQEVMEYPRRLTRRLHPEDRHRVLGALDQLRSGRLHMLEYRIVDPLTGSIKWIKDIGFPIPNGRIGGIAADVTKKRLAEDQIQLLSQEVSHRAKNLLAVVQSIARQTAADGEPTDFAEGFTQRIAGLAASLDLLVNSGWRGADLRRLVDSQLAPFVDLKRNRLDVEGPELTVESSAAQTLGMALHELATNSTKYGALSSVLGRISIEWRLRNDGGLRHFHMTWRETGGAETKAPTYRGFGHVVLVSVVEYSLSATVQLQYPSSGIIWDVNAPVQSILHSVAEA